MTFSLIGQSIDKKEWGVAVASKFLAVGAYVPAVAAEAGAIATQAYGNLAIRTKGLEMLRQGMSAQEMLDAFLANDPQREERQIGVIDAAGEAVTFTGRRCQAWAGGRAEAHAKGSYAAQGNMLVGPEVLDDMVTSWLANSQEQSLPND